MENNQLAMFVILHTLIYTVILLAKLSCGFEVDNSVSSLMPPVTQEISPIQIIGNKFFDKDSGMQFFIKGIAYQRNRDTDEVYDRTEETPYLDSLANETSCIRDLNNFVDLGVNVVRVYQINPKANHDFCMNKYAEAGIYVLADLAEPELSINRDSPTWDVDLYERYTSVIDSMHSYNNLLGFLGGNEVTNSKVNTDASPFVKASIRDMKKYMIIKGYRQIPIGYATNDDADIRKSLSDYFVCSTAARGLANGTSDALADFLGVNMYEWCGYSTYTTSGYRERTVEYSNFPVPLFFSEYGCNTVSPRPFTEVEALYGSTMSKVWSGGIAYEYFEGTNQYGIVKSDSSGTLTKLEDFEILKQRLHSVDPHLIHIRDHEDTLSKQGSVECPAVLAESIWKASNELPPKPDTGKCECLQSTLSCVVTPYKNVNENSILAEVCSKTDCHEIESNAEIGYYGRFSDCGIKQKISYALNKYYVDKGRKSDSCDFEGQAVLITNSNVVDLENIFAQDGRTCKEAIGEDLSYSDKKYENYMKNKQVKTSNQTFQNPAYSANRKLGSKSMKSSSNKLGGLNLISTSILTVLLVNVFCHL